MKPPSFAYHDPETVDEAIGLLVEYGDEAKILAGGQSLVPMLNFRLLSPSCLVDINRIEALAGIRETQDGVVIGSATRQRAVERSDVVKRMCPLLNEAMPNIAHFQIRNRGTVGGSLSHADPAAELPAVMTALGASFVVKGQNGERRVAAGDFFVGYLTTDLDLDEIVTDIHIPAQPKACGSAFLEMSRRHGDFALAGVACWVTVDEVGACTAARIALTGVAETPYRAASVEEALVGTLLDDAACADAVGPLAATLDPPEDLHASADYRRHAAGILVTRAVSLAAKRARAARGIGS